MTSQTIRVARGARGTGERGDWPSGFETVLLAGAPVAAVLAGAAAGWLDFRALRIPLLALVLAGVLGTSYALGLSGHHSSRRHVGRTIALGVGTWAAAETLYVIVHAASGETFSAERFGPQWSQAMALIGVHAGFLGAPTGVAAAVLLRARQWITKRR